MAEEASHPAPPPTDAECSKLFDQLATTARSKAEAEEQLAGLARSRGPAYVKRFLEWLDAQAASRKAIPPPAPSMTEAEKAELAEEFAALAPSDSPAHVEEYMSWYITRMVDKNLFWFHVLMNALAKELGFRNWYAALESLPIIHMFDDMVKCLKCFDPSWYTTTDGQGRDIIDHEQLDTILEGFRRAANCGRRPKQSRLAEQHKGFGEYVMANPEVSLEVLARSYYGDMSKKALKSKRDVAKRHLNKHEKHLADWGRLASDS
jgi:hypothetical protein